MPEAQGGVTEKINPWRLFHGVFVPNWLVRLDDVSAGAKLCYGRLAQYAGRKGVAEPDQARLASELGVGDRMVRRYLSELVEKGLIVVEQVGLNQANRYEFLHHEAMQMSGPDRNDSSTPERNDSSGPSLCLKESVTTRDSMFDAAWTSYPRKVNKVGARKAWDARVRAGVDPEEMVTAAGHYATACEGKEQEFVMHGATFFGPNERWRDYLTPPAKPSPWDESKITYV